ncbi:hypothetical protein ACFY4I_14855 [Streptomyces scabiei]
MEEVGTFSLTFFGLRVPEPRGRALETLETLEVLEVLEVLEAELRTRFS